MDYVFDTSNLKRYRFPTHINDLVMDRSQAAASEVFVVIIEPGKAPPLHIHDDTEQIFFVLDGTGRLEIGEDTKEYPVVPGDVVRIPPSTWHAIHCESSTPLRYLAIDCFPGGRPTAEPTWESHVRVVCDGMDWDFDEVVES